MAVTSLANRVKKLEQAPQGRPGGWHPGCVGRDGHLCRIIWEDGAASCIVCEGPCNPPACPVCGLVAEHRAMPVTTWADCVEKFTESQVNVSDIRAALETYPRTGA